MSSKKTVQRPKEIKLNLEKNDLFHIEFDLPTPRPHFIILLNSIKKSSVRDLDENELRSLLQLVFKFREKTNNNLGDLILSFHTGSWATCKYFHAHICVDVDLYLNMVKNTSFEHVVFRPTRKWLIKGEPDQPIKDLYIENVKNSTKTIKHESNKYRLDEINLIRTKQRNLIDSTELNSNKYDIYFDMKEPNLKFILNNNMTSSNDANNNELKQTTIEDKYVDLIQTMIQFASKFDFFSKQNGCHICLNIRDNSSNSTKVQVDGFIKMSGDKFYDMHPLRELFLQCFELNENYTTKS